MNVLRGGIIAVWFFGSLYLGSGGITSLELAAEETRINELVVDANDTIPVILDEKEFKSRSEAIVYLEDKQFKENKKLAEGIFPWLNLPYTFLSLLITSFAFGSLGGSISVLRDITLDKPKIDEAKIFSKPILGGGCGVVILSISYILPVLIVTGETQIRTISIVFVSLFGGLFTEHFYLWLSTVFGKIFK